MHTITKASIIGICCVGILSCQTKSVDTTKVYDQKYIDSTLYMIKDSLDKRMVMFYDSLLNAEAEAFVDSLQNNPKHADKFPELDLKSPPPPTRNLPEPSGPDYTFPEE